MTGRFTRYILLSVLLYPVSSSFAQDIDQYQVNKLTRYIAQSHSRNDSAGYMMKLGELYASNTTLYSDRALLWLDKSIALSDTLKINSIRLQALLLKSFALAKKKDFSNSRKCYKAVISWYLQHHEFNKAAAAYDWLHNVFYHDNITSADMIREAIYFCRQEREIFKILNDQAGITKTYKDEADVNLYIRNLDATESLLDTTLMLYKANHYRKLQDVYYLLGASSHLRGDLHRELYYELKTITAMKASGDSTDRNLFYFKLVQTYQNLGQYDQALNYLAILNHAWPNCARYAFEIMNVCIVKKNYAFARKFFKANVRRLEIKSKEDKAQLNLMYALNSVAEGDINTAERYYQRTIRNAEMSDDLEGNGAVLKLLIYRESISFYLNVHNYGKAGFYLKKLDQLSKYTMSYLFLAKMEFFKFKADSGNKKFLSAIKHYELNRKMMDSIFNYSKSRQIADLEINYAVKDKDTRISILAKEAQLEKEKLAEKSAFARYLIVTLLLLIIILVGLFSRFRLKQRTMKLLAAKQQEIVGKNEELKQLLMDNEWLVREMHHRVKNNLQTIIGLLQSQSAFLKDKIALETVLDSQHRIHAMSLIHQKLYKEELGTVIFMPEYINDLVGYLKQSYKTGTRILIEQLVDKIYFDVSIAVPVGLILNEILTNCLKYAFPQNQEGNVIIRLYCPDDVIACLEVADNGCGFSPAFDQERSDSFGMTLIKGLIENDLDGKFEVTGIEGTRYTISFKINPEV